MRKVSIAATAVSPVSNKLIRDASGERGMPVFAFILISVQRGVLPILGNAMAVLNLARTPRTQFLAENCTTDRKLLSDSTTDAFLIKTKMNSV